MRYIDIPESNYAVTETGRVFNKRTGRFMSTQRDKNKLKIALIIGGKITSCRIHWLVAVAFVPNPEGFGYIGFKDGNKDNVHYTNLYWKETEAGGKPFAKESLQELSEPKAPNLTEYDSPLLALKDKNREFSSETMMEIRQEIKRGRITPKEAAYLYGVTVPIIRQIINC